MKHILGIIIGVACILAMLSVAGWFILKPAPLLIEGEIDATQVQVASKLTGRIETLEVSEGDTVKAGQIMATIDSPEIQAKMKQATAAKKAASAQQEKAYSGARKEEIRMAMNVWQQVKAASELSQKTYERVLNLNRDGVLPAQKLDEAEAKLKADQRAEKAAKANYDMALAGARKEDQEAATALTDEASGVVAEVEAYLEETRLIAPIDGEVAEIIPERGELISPGYPIIILVDLKNVWITFNLREDLLSKVRMGTTFSAQFPALGNKKSEFKVNYISALGDFATWRATKASGDFDLKTFEVRATPVVPLEGLRPGMSAIVNWDELPALNRFPQSANKSATDGNVIPESKHN